MWLWSAVAKSEKTRTDRLIGFLSLATLFLFGSVVLGLSYIQYFSRAVYPNISSTLGGGRPQTVVFLVDTSHDPPVITDGSGSRSIPYLLLLQTENDYVVESQAKGEKAIVFHQDSVRGMIVLQK